MDDRPISLNKAIDALEKRTGLAWNYLKILHPMLCVLEEISSAQPRWIPCSRELPNEDGQYNITVEYEHVDGYEDIYSEHGYWIDDHWDNSYGHCGKVIKVLAWQPLPQPYKEAQNETN